MREKLPAMVVIHLPDLLEYLAETDDHEMKKNLVRQYYNKDKAHANHLRFFVELAYHPSIIWELPDGTPPYRSASTVVGQAPSTLFKVFRVLARFLRGGADFIRQEQRRSTYFIQLLESLSEAEAELLIAIKNKDLSKYDGVYINIFTELFPDWFPKEFLETVPPLQSPDAKVEQSQSSGIVVSAPTEELKQKSSPGRPKKQTTGGE